MEKGRCRVTCRSTAMVCTQTPSTTSTTTIAPSATKEMRRRWIKDGVDHLFGAVVAPSQTRTAVETSEEKSMWPAEKTRDLL